MAYKKYIKRGGKVYGPYLYHSKRVGNKVVTTYMGQAEENKSKKYLNYFYLVLLLLFFVLYFILYSGSGEFLAGRVGGGEFDDPADIGEAIPDPPPYVDVDGEDEVIIDPGQSVSLKKPPILITVSEIAGLETGFLVVRETKQVGVAIGGKLTEFSLTLQASNVLPTVVINFPPGVRYPSFSGKSDEVFIRTKVLGEVNIFDLARQPDGLIEIIIKGLEPGLHSLNFYMQGPYLSNVEFRSNGEEVTFTNPLDVDYEDVSVIVPVNFEVDSDRLVVLSPEEERVDHVTFDINDDRKPDFIKFNIREMDADSEITFKILELGVKKIETKEVDSKQAIVSEIDIEDIPAECEVICNSYSPCARRLTSSAFVRGVITGGVELSTCVSNNPVGKCSPVYEVVRACDLPGEDIIITEEEVPDVFLEPGEEIGNMRVVSDKETGRIVAYIIVSPEKKIDITFTQSKPIDFSPSTCYNGIQDVRDGEEGVDCGGPCGACAEGEQKDLAFLWWGALLILVLLFFYLDRSRVVKIRRYLRLGRRALAERDLKTAIRHYNDVRRIYNRSRSKEKLLVKQACLRYYLRIKKSLEKRDVKVKFPKSWRGLPTLVYHSKNLVFEEVSGSDVSRIDKLVNDGVEDLQDKDTKSALVNYVVIRKIYSHLDGKQSRKIKRKCRGYFKKIKRYLVNEGKQFDLGEGVLPEIFLKKSNR